MYPEVDRLRNGLLFYHFVDNGAGTHPILQVQVGPGRGDTMAFTLLQEKPFSGSVKLFSFPQTKPLHTFSVEDGDVVLLHSIRNDEIATAGGIWQVQWKVPWENRALLNPGGRYVLEEITSSRIEMVEVEELLQEKDFTLFQEAVTHAITFLEAQGRFSNSWFVNGREIGAMAPETIYQIAPFPPDIRVIEHTWYIVLAGDKEDNPRPASVLMEVVYHVQNQKWQFSVRILEEQDDSSESAMS